MLSGQVVFVGLNCEFWDSIWLPMLLAWFANGLWVLLDSECCWVGLLLWLRMSLDVVVVAVGLWLG